jgi:hypothetical protein
MPLLDLLKELNVAAEAPRRTYSSAEDWISMSTASGLGNYPFLAESTAEPSMHTSADRHDGLSGSQAVRMEDGSGDLWPRVTAIAPQLLLDKYVSALLQ